MALIASNVLMLLRISSRIGALMSSPSRCSESHEAIHHRAIEEGALHQPLRPGAGWEGSESLDPSGTLAGRGDCAAPRDLPPGCGEKLPGMLCLGKSDFEAITNFRHNRFF